MKLRTTLILLALVVLVGLALFLLSGSEEPPRPGSVGLNAPLFPSFTSAGAAKIALQRGAEETVLEKRAGGWWIAKPLEFQADAEAVQKLLEKVAQLKPVEVISTNPEKHALFQVDDGGLRVTIRDAAGAVLAGFILGKRGSDFAGTYVRRDQGREVLLAPEVLIYSFDKKPTSWRDLTIFRFDPGGVQQLSLDDGVARIMVGRDDAGSWRLREPQEEPADKAAVDGLLERLAKLRAAGIDDAASLEAAGLLAPSSTIEVATAEGQNFTLQIGKAVDERQTYARRADRDTVYRLFSGQVRTLTKRLEELREKPKPEPKPAAPGAAPGAGAGASVSGTPSRPATPPGSQSSEAAPPQQSPQVTPPPSAPHDGSTKTPADR
ncbi:MAG: DUF4340 domain-containing protein [Candidatus Tectomicrobia bacterium]|nr:DUF4340 domain-containing protein [Candidatus Tectomicrobia bacterium]